MSGAWEVLYDVSSDKIKVCRLSIPSEFGLALLLDSFVLAISLLNTRFNQDLAGTSSLIAFVYLDDGVQAIH
jgi:hypothetical protein